MSDDNDCGKEHIVLKSRRAFWISGYGILHLGDITRKCGCRLTPADK